MRRILADFAPDVVHLASPFELGRRAMRAADQLDIPTVAVYQTDVPGYLGKYGLPFLEAWAWQRVIAIHQSATRTLAPSLSAARQLELHGIRESNCGAAESTRRAFTRASEVQHSARRRRRTENY